MYIHTVEFVPSLVTRSVPDDGRVQHVHDRRGEVVVIPVGSANVYVLPDGVGVRDSPLGRVRASALLAAGSRYFEVTRWRRESWGHPAGANPLPGHMPTHTYGPESGDANDPLNGGEYPCEVTPEHAAALLAAGRVPVSGWPPELQGRPEAIDALARSRAPLESWPEAARQAVAAMAV